MFGSYWLDQRAPPEKKLRHCPNSESIVALQFSARSRWVSRAEGRLGVFEQVGSYRVVGSFLRNEEPGRQVEGETCPAHQTKGDEAHPRDGRVDAEIRSDARGGPGDHPLVAGPEDWSSWPSEPIWAARPCSWACLTVWVCLGVWVCLCVC
jgi:hypothetical protein